MTTSSVATGTAAVRHVRVNGQTLVVELRDGRVVSVPIGWYPRLAEGTPRERRRWELLGAGVGIHWPDLDEDISVEGLLKGLPSGESVASLDAWRAARHSVLDLPTRPTSRVRRKTRSKPPGR